MGKMPRSRRNSVALWSTDSGIDDRRVVADMEMRLLSAEGEIASAEHLDFKKLTSPLISVRSVRIDLDPHLLPLKPLA